MILVLSVNHNSVPACDCGTGPRHWCVEIIESIIGRPLVAADIVHISLESKEPCWNIWGANSTWRCVRDSGHAGGCQFVNISREARRTWDNHIPESVNEGK